MRGVPEPELVLALRRGEPAAFDEVYQRYRDRIFRFLCRMAGRREVAEDLFQETFLQLARHAGRLQEGSDLGAWLYTVARNRCRSHLRWAVLESLGRRQLGPPLGAAEPAPDAGIGLREVERALASLAPDRREVLLLLGVEGLPPEQVARILGVTGEALRQRLSRARAELAQRLEGCSGGGRRRARDGAT